MAGELGVNKMTTKTERAKVKTLMARAERDAVAGAYDRMYDSAQAVLNLDPDHAGALELLAKALWQRANLEELLPVIDKLVSLNPYEPGYYSLRGSALQSLGRLGEAARAFYRAAEISSGAEQQHALDALQELQEWQRALVADLLDEDPVFHAGYAQDAERACLSRGFALVNLGATAYRLEGQLN